MNKGELRWLGATKDSVWLGRQPPSVGPVAIEFPDMPVVGHGFLFRDLDRLATVRTSLVESVMQEGLTTFFTTENSRYRIEGR